MKDIPYLSPKTHQTTFEISLSAIRDNFKYYKSLLNPNTKVIVMVKAFAYGLGLSKIAEVLQEIGADYLAVAYTDEGVELRKSGVTMPILVFNPEPQCFDNIIQYKLQPEIYSTELLKTYLHHINQNAAYQLIDPLPIHIKIDTGMHRLGMDPNQVNELVELTKDNTSIEIKTVFSHLHAAENPKADNQTIKQVEMLTQIHEKIQQNFNHTIGKHILNTAGIERFGQYQFDMVRLGIGLYGVGSTEKVKNKLQIACTLKSRIAQIKHIKKGEYIGYGVETVAQTDLKLAIVFLGYADGLPRSLSNGNGKLWINGAFAKIIGYVCMDITIVDVTDIDVKVGDIAEVFGANYSLNEFANNIGTIPYEVLTDISSRVRRIYS